MTTYVALLRGINLGAHNRMKMDDLRELFDGLGSASVETYIKSGNVVFGSGETGEKTIRSTIPMATVSSGTSRSCTRNRRRNDASAS